MDEAKKDSTAYVSWLQRDETKKELIRVVRNNEGEINIDLVGKKPGRGAYICKSVDCLENAIKAKRLEKAFETAIDVEIYNNLKNQLEGNDG